MENNFVVEMPRSVRLDPQVGAGDGWKPASLGRGMCCALFLGPIIHHGPTMQTPDCSTELVIDSIVLNVEVLHSIRNNLPIPLENLLVQKIRRPKPTYPWRTLASVIVVCLGMVSMFLLSGSW